jgi:hypothetical protein
MNYLGEHLTGRINMDGNRFDKCVFRDAVLVYSGGRPPILFNNDFARCSFLFEGEAANAIRFLTGMRRIGFRDLVDSTLYNIKTGYYDQVPGKRAAAQNPSTEDDARSAPVALIPTKHATTAPPILVNRSAFIDVVALARRAAEDGSGASALANAVLALEAERHRLEWDDADTSLPIGSYAGDERGYFRMFPARIEERKPGHPPLRVLWRGGKEEITVVDQPPVPAGRMARLKSLGIARPRSWMHLVSAPFTFVDVADPRWCRIRTPSLAVEKAVGTPGGAWIVAGENREPLAWVGRDMDASYMAEAVNMALELEMDVARGSYGLLNFPGQIKESGILGLVRMLRRSIEPQERWEREPSDALRAAGAELEKRLVEFLTEVRPRRLNRQKKDKAR